MIIKYFLKNTQISSIVFIILWYLVWVPVCIFVLYVLINNPKFYFGYLWMIFGVFGLALAPISIIELFTSYEFSETNDEYILTVISIFRMRCVKIKKDHFVGFECKYDEDKIQTNFLYVVYKDASGKTNKIQVLFWIKNSIKNQLIKDINWKSAQQVDTPEPMTLGFMTRDL